MMYQIEANYQQFGIKQKEKEKKRIVKLWETIYLYIKKIFKKRNTYILKKQRNPVIYRGKSQANS